MRGTFAASDLASTETVTIGMAETSGQAERLALRVLGRRRRRQQYFRVVACGLRWWRVAPRCDFSRHHRRRWWRGIWGAGSTGTTSAEPRVSGPQRATGLVGKASLARQQSRRPRTRDWGGAGGVGIAATPVASRWGFHPSGWRRRWWRRWSRLATPAVVAGGAGGGLAPTGWRRRAGRNGRRFTHGRQWLARLPTQVAGGYGGGGGTTVTASTAGGAGGAGMPEEAVMAAAPA